MTDGRDRASCTRKSWGLAALAGVVIGLAFWVVGGWSFLGALVLGLVVAVIVGLVLSRILCPVGQDLVHGTQGRTAPGQPASAPPAAGQGDAAVAAGAAGTASVAPAAKPEAAPAAAQGVAADSAPSAAPAEAGAAQANAAPKVKPSAALPGQAELASRKGAWKYEAPGARDASVAAATPPVTENAGGEVAPEVDTTQAAGAPTAAATAAAAATADPATAEAQPALQQGPRPEGADDLKKIRGVGPKLETMLNELGIWHYDQIAAWGPAEIAWVDGRVRFSGRIERDNWVAQARALAGGDATGGTT